MFDRSFWLPALRTWEFIPRNQHHFTLLYVTRFPFTLMSSNYGFFIYLFFSSKLQEHRQHNTWHYGKVLATSSKNSNMLKNLPILGHFFPYVTKMFFIKKFCDNDWNWQLSAWNETTRNTLYIHAFHFLTGTCRLTHYPLNSFFF